MPIGDKKSFPTKTLDTSSLEEENQTMITARKANAMIREYTNNFKSLIQVGMIQNKTIEKIIYVTKWTSTNAGKLFKWLKSEKDGSKGGDGAGLSESDPAIDCWHVRLNNFFAASGF